MPICVLCTNDSYFLATMLDPDYDPDYNQGEDASEEVLENWCLV